MYEEIRKPKMLQDVPLSLIRPLPVIYYTNKFANGDVPEKIKNLYLSNLTYLGDALGKTAKIVDNKDFQKISSSLAAIGDQISKEQLNEIQVLTLAMADLCKKTKQDLRKKNLELKTNLMDHYAKRIDPLKILVIAMEENAGNIQKVMGVLKSFCQYTVDCCHYDQTEVSEKIVDADFAVFSSTSSPDIHQQVKKLETYSTPGIALVPIDKKNNNLERAIRHGSQLLRAGFPVLFRMFTPLRLFTSIEKTYLDHHLS
jgi:hypothetical protein